MKDFFDLKNTRYDFHNKQLLKLPENSTSRYGIQTLCFKGSVIWNMVLNKFKNLDIIEEFKKHMKDWKPTTCSCQLCLQLYCNFGFSCLLIWFCWYILVRLFVAIL